MVKSKQPAGTLNRAGWLYVVLTGLGVLIFWSILIRIYMPVPRGKSFLAALLDELHNPDGRGVMAAIVIGASLLSAVLNAASRAKKSKRFVTGDGDLLIALGQAALEGAVQITAAGVSEVSGDFGGGGSFGGGGATGSW